MNRPLLPYGATASRPGWRALPVELRALIEDRLGAAVCATESQGGGFTGGFASRLRLSDGSRAFVKAASATTAPVVHASYRQEIRVSQALPPEIPAPRLLWSAEPDDWIVLAFEDVDGVLPQRPWLPGELHAVLAVLPGLAEPLTPPPPQLHDLPTTADLDQQFSFWRRAAARAGGPDRDLVPEPWRATVPRLAALESQWTELASGDTAVHFDLRDDNILLTGAGQVLVCDWNWLTRAAAWVDLVGLLVGVHGDGLDADAILGEHPLSARVDPLAVDAFLAALAGYFIDRAAQPAVPGSPWLRAHQAWWRDATLSWLGLRLAPDCERQVQ